MYRGRTYRPTYKDNKVTKIIDLVVAVLICVYFAAFLVATYHFVKTGGTARAGYESAGQYWVSAHARTFPVSKDDFTRAWIAETIAISSICIFMPLALLNQGAKLLLSRR